MKPRIFLLLPLLYLYFSALAAPPADEGKTIFSTHCAGCHNVNKILTGPALAGVDQRHSIDWIVSFVHSSQTMVKAGDTAAVNLFNRFNHIPMPDHPDLSVGNIKSIVEYIKTEAAAGNEKAPFARPYHVRPNYTPLTIENYGFFLSFLAIVALLVGVLIFAVRVKQYERQANAEKQ